jgi:hypothetical protein
MYDGPVLVISSPRITRIEDVARISAQFESLERTVLNDSDFERSFHFLHEVLASFHELLNGVREFERDERANREVPLILVAPAEIEPVTSEELARIWRDSRVEPTSPTWTVLNSGRMSNTEAETSEAEPGLESIQGADGHRRLTCSESRLMRSSIGFRSRTAERPRGTKHIERCSTLLRARSHKRKAISHRN